jgi:hypothetical protein
MIAFVVVVILIVIVPVIIGPQRTNSICSLPVCIIE